MDKFMHGTKLAMFQDNLIKKLQTRYSDKYYVSDKEIRDDEYLADDMSQNKWVKLARRVAPNNLVLRQYCLIDILNQRPYNYDKIYKLISQLSPVSPNGRLWLEGYTYWLYCKEVLYLYSKVFEEKYRPNVSIPLSLIIVEIDNCFQKTSYSDNLDFLYPAPVGALRKVSLENHLQDNRMSIPNISIHPIKKMTNGIMKYEVKKSLLGFNTHVPDRNYVATINGGCVENFEFYKGFDKKYKTKWDEIKDTFLRWDRIFSALKLLIGS